MNNFILFGITYSIIGFLSRLKLNRNGKIIADEVTNVNKSLQEGFGSIRELILYNSRKYKLPTPTNK